MAGCAELRCVQVIAQGAAGEVALTLSHAACTNIDLSGVLLWRLVLIRSHARFNRRLQALENID